MNNSIPRAIPFLGCLLARLPACPPFFLPGFQLNSKSKAKTTASIYQPRKHTQSPPHSPSNPKIPQHEAQPLFVFSTANQTHPPTGSSTRTKPKAKQKHTHTEEPELPKHKLLLPLLPPPSPYASTESKPIRAKTIQPHLTLFSRQQSIPVPTFSFLSISLSLLFSLLPSLPTSSSFACFPPPQPKTRKERKKIQTKNTADSNTMPHTSRL